MSSFRYSKKRGNIYRFSRLLVKFKLGQSHNIRRKLPYRVEYKKNHKNTKDEPAPWVIINADRNEIVGSSRTKETAESSIRARLAGEHGGLKARKS